MHLSLDTHKSPITNARAISSQSRLKYVYFVALFCAFPLFFSFYDCLADGWTAVGDNIEVATKSVSSGIFPAEVTLVRIPYERYRIEVVRASQFGKIRSDVKSLVKASKAVFGINANFFDEQGKPLGLVVNRGHIYQSIHKGGSALTGIFSIKSSGPEISNRSEFNLQGVLESVQAGPRLLMNGKRIENLKEPSSYSKRAGVCIDARRRVIFYAVSSGVIGANVTQIQDLLLQVGCLDALNLDGGGSAQMYMDSNLRGASRDQQELSIQGSDEVPVILAFFN